MFIFVGKVKQLPLTGKLPVQSGPYTTVQLLWPCNWTVYVKLQVLKRSLSRKNDHNALWH